MIAFNKCYKTSSHQISSKEFKVILKAIMNNKMNNFRWKIIIACLNQKMENKKGKRGL